MMTCEMSASTTNEMTIFHKTPPRMLTVKQTALETGIAPFRIRQWCREKEIVHIHAGRKILVNYDKFLEFLWSSGMEHPQTDDVVVQQYRGIRPVQI